MLSDIFNQPQKATIENKEYLFEYNHAALAALEKRTGKSPYEIYDTLMTKNQVMLNDSVAMVSCAMLKSHTTEEILKIEEKLQTHPGLWYEIREPVISSFIIPMLPHEIMRKLEEKENAKKKQKQKTSKKKNMSGSKTSS